MAAKYDLLLKGGEVIDPGQNIRGARDVAFQGGSVAAVIPDIPVDQASEVIDVTGKLVTPGLVDIHGHYDGHLRLFDGYLGTLADEACLPFGVTTSVDAGSVGALHFHGFNEYVLSKQQTRLYAFLNLSILGMFTLDGDFGRTLGVSDGPRTILPPNRLGELNDLRYAHVEKAIERILENSDVVLGVKVRIDTGITGEANAVACLERARQVADSTDSIIMVHVARSPIPLATILDHLRPGDIATHMFNYNEHNILDEVGQVRPEVVEARSKGIVMDVGAARTSFGVEISQAAIQQGFLPDTLGTDRISLRPGIPVSYSMPEVMSMFMGMGMTLDEVVRAATVNGAKAIGKEDALGTLRTGSVGDAAVLELEEGDFAYDDATGTAVRCNRRFTPVLTVKDGVVWRGPAS